MNASSGEDVIPDRFEYVECDAIVHEGEHDEGPCDFHGGMDIWIDPPAGTWGYTCPNCDHTHVHDLSSLRSWE